MGSEIQAYREGVGMAPTGNVASAEEVELSSATGAIRLGLLDELWSGCDAKSWGLARKEFDRILLEAGIAWNYGIPEGLTASQQQQAAFFRPLCLSDLVLARACAAGDERAWERFFALYQQPLIRAGIAITGSETLGRELADQLYAELYGLNSRDGERRCPLLSYRGRGSLMGWLRTTLAQRHVDSLRRTRRLAPLEDDLDPRAPDPVLQTPAAELSDLERAIETALKGLDAQEQFLLAAYYLDGKTLFEIARVLGVHEATVSRKLKRATLDTRKQVLKILLRGGMSRRAAEEALGADVRDLNVNLKKLLQNSQIETFKEQAET